MKYYARDAIIAVVLGIFQPYTLAAFYRFILA
jgi:uncharacterized membrane protein